VDIIAAEGCQARAGEVIVALSTYDSCGTVSRKRHGPTLVCRANCAVAHQLASLLGKQLRACGGTHQQRCTEQEGIKSEPLDGHGFTPFRKVKAGASLRFVVLQDSITGCPDSLDSYSILQH
jgi:hypothetical protein